jgi:MFS family permease
MVFTAASLAGGLARDPWLLIAARLLQGVGAAALASSSLSLITASHPEGPARTRALSLWAAVGSSAGAVGVVLGGLLTTELSWRYVLFINVPIGVALLIAAAASLVPSPTGRGWDRLDLPGALTVTAGVSSLVFGVSQATSKGWGSLPVIAALTAAVVLLAAFGMIEARSAAPLVPLSILRRRSLAVGNIVMAGLGVVMTSGFFFLSLYLQQILGYSALRTGAAIVPMTVLLAAGPLAAKRLLPRFGPRFLTLAGGILTTRTTRPASSAPCWSSGPASGSRSFPWPHPPRPASSPATPGWPPACSTRRASSAAPSASPCSSPSPPPPPATATSPAPRPPPSTATASPCSSARPSAWPRSSLPSSCPPSQ